MTKNKIINIGILGCANIADRHIIPNIKSLTNEFNLIGIASRSYDKANALAGKFNTTPFGSYQELLDLPEIDAIYIPLPNSMHYEWVKKCIKKQIHVLVEKSLACTLSEVEELNNLAKEKNIILVENFQFRFHYQLTYIKDLIKQGAIGEIRSLRSSFGFPPFSDKDNIRYQKELGGGALLDAGAYPLKISQILLGNDLEVKAASLNYDKVTDVDIWGGAFLQSKSSSLFSEISFGFDHYYQCNIEIWGSKGKLTTNRIFTAPPGYKPEIIIEKQNEVETTVLDEDNHFQNMLSHFYSLIFGNEDKNSEYIQNINQARLLKELREIADVRKQ